MSDQPTITISRGSGETAPEVGPYSEGVAERATWPADEHTPAAFTAEHVPGGRTLATGLVTGIVVPIQTSARYYDQDGLSFGVGADEGHVYVATVRAATAEEAAPILAAEQRAAQAQELARRTRALLRWRYPNAEVGATYTHPLTGPTPDTAVPVPQAPDYGHSPFPDRILIDRAADLVWTLVYNGADGNDWSLSNHGAHIALSHALTPEREQLVADLTAFYADAAAWERLGVQAEAMHALIAAGWTLPAYREVETMRVVDVADVAALTSRTSQEWQSAGWPLRHHPHWTGDQGWRASEAAALVEAGMTFHLAKALREQGHRTVRDALAARPPHVPEGATRVRLSHPRPEVASPFEGDIVTGSAEEMNAYLAIHPEQWTWTLHAERGPRIRHTASSGSWQLWDDNSITHGYWYSSHIDGRPRELSTAAETAVGLAVRAERVEESALWQPLLAATDHSVRHIDHTPGSPWGDGIAAGLERHEFALPAAHSVTWWVCWTERYTPGDGDIWDQVTTLHHSEAEARQAAAERLRELRAA
ncbi:hypothetical protein [Nocardiopsis synnemataformans]|uniref:hypothetical protein n=1 Tax=Nocardiopsis synnemataformans TaxID=61305 RepID=UPI003EB8D0CA